VQIKQEIARTARNSALYSMLFFF